MGCKCGSQIILCNLPVRFDTYRGCSHGCRYCFAQKKNDISHIERDESVDGLRSFIEGKRGNETEWCDWNIPIHWGGIRLHPHYEAKTMQWFRSSGIAPESTLFWITGAEPRSPGQS